MQAEQATIDLWSFSLDCDSDLLSLAEELLSEDERARAARFRFGRHRRRFVVRRSMRRIVLAQLTGLGPREIRITESDHGKPQLAGVRKVLEFNCSHSGERAIIVTGSVPFGVDIEALDRPLDYLRFARHSFTDEEYSDIRRSCGSDRRIAFFNCWTGKEAYIKALGLGLSKKLNSFAVRCAPDEPPGLRWDEEQLQHPPSCSFLRHTDDDYVTTIVLSGSSEAPEPIFHELSGHSFRTLEPV